MSWPVQSFQMFKLCRVQTPSLHLGLCFELRGPDRSRPDFSSHLMRFCLMREQCKREGPLYSGRDALAALELWPSGQDLARASCPRIPWEVAIPVDTEEHCKRQSQMCLIWSVTHWFKNMNLFLPTWLSKRTWVYLVEVFELGWQIVSDHLHGLEWRLIEVRRLSIHHFNDHNAKWPNIHL